MNKIFEALLILILGVAVFGIVEYSSPDYSSFAGIVLNISVVYSLLTIIDNTFLKGFNTIEELKNNNIAVGIALAGLFIMLGLSAVSVH